MVIKSKKNVMGWIKSLTIALIAVVIVRTFLFAPYYVEGASMEPTLRNHERIFVNKLSSFTDHIDRGDVVIIERKEENKNYVKRIIGFPGEKVEMKKDHLYINGNPMKESYLSQNRERANEIGSQLTGDFGPIIVPEDHYFVMGDNRLYSMDSRNGLGFIKEKSIVGKSEFVFYPFPELRSME